LKEEIGRLTKEVEADLFRIVQESLANVHRHSGSSTATVRLERQKNQIVVQVQDQGRGFSKTAVVGEPGGVGSLGVGISGMQQRLRQLGGRLRIESSDQGTTVTAIVPLSVSLDQGSCEKIRCD
jgi:signal transduction histidine kinase